LRRGEKMTTKTKTVPTLEDFEAAPEGTVAVDEDGDGVRRIKRACGGWFIDRPNTLRNSSKLMAGCAGVDTVLIYPEGKKP
jgi:hypothetical protein